MGKLEPVNVYLRIRPFKEEEQNSKSNDILEVLSDREVQVKHQHPKRFGFNKLFTSKSNQAAIYQSVVAPLVDKVLSGYTCTLLTYGQSGTGKTYTLFGDTSDHTKYGSEDSFDGCVPRALISIFNEMKKLDKNTERTVRVSYVELFNEELVDLLHDNSEPSQPLRVHEDPEQKGNMYIQNLSACTICDSSDIKRIFEIAEENRNNSSVLEDANKCSHKLFIINVHTRTVTLPGDERLKSGKIVFVCVAGCENLRRNGKVNRKGNLLNQSLVMLTNVVRAMEERNSYVPHSESKLTKILREAFGGRSKTAIIATVSPTRSDIEDTLATLNFARGAKTIKNPVEMNKITTKSNIVNCLSAELNKLQKDLLALRSATGFYVDAQNYTDVVKQTNQKAKELNEKMKQIADMENKIRELETTKLTKEKEWESLNASFELTKRMAIFHKKKLLKRRALAENVKGAVEAVQTASLPVLEQNDELKSLVKISTNQCKILESKTVSAQEKLSHNNLLRKGLCKTLMNKCTDMVQSVEQEGNEMPQRLITLCSNMKCTVESLNEDSCRNADEVSYSVAELQSALKSDASDDMKLALEKDITNFSTRSEQFFNDYNLSVEQLEKQRELLKNTSEETAQQYKNFYNEQIKSTDVLHSVNEDVLASVEMQNKFLNDTSETLMKFQESIAANDNTKNGIETCSTIKANLQNLIESYTTEEVFNDEMTDLLAKAQFCVEQRAQQITESSAVCANLFSDIDDCVKMVEKENENAHPSIFNSDIDNSILKEKISVLEKLLRENNCCLESVAAKADMSVDIHQTLQNFCHDDVAVSKQLNQKISSKLEEFFKLHGEVEARKEMMYSNITETLKTLTDTVNELLEEQFRDDDGIESTILPPSEHDLLNEDLELPHQINQVLGKLEKLQRFTE